MNKELSTPQVILLTDNSQDSKKARELLISKGVEFVERDNFVPEKGLNPPLLYAKSGEFRGIKGVKLYIDITE